MVILGLLLIDDFCYLLKKFLLKSYQHKFALSVYLFIIRFFYD